ncbi:MAG: hypothetical protein Kilf2KO_47630 [Rhodospirillales bacterium]
MDLDQEIALLGRSRLFRGCDAEELELLAYIGIPVSFAPGEVLLQQGAVTDHTYYIVSGEVEIVMASGMAPAAFRTLGESLMLGVVSALTARPSPWGIAAASQVEALSFPAEDLRRFLIRVPEVAVLLLEHVAGRMLDHIDDWKAAAQVRRSE